MRIGDLISFKPKSFGDDDWSNPCVVIGGFISDDRNQPTGGHRDMIWIVWCDGGKYMVNERNDDVVYLTNEETNIRTWGSGSG